MLLNPSIIAPMFEMFSQGNFHMLWRTVLVRIYLVTVFGIITIDVLYKGWTPLQRACVNGHWRIVQLLLKNDANLEVQSEVHSFDCSTK